MCPLPRLPLLCALATLLLLARPFGARAEPPLLVLDEPPQPLARSQPASFEEADRIRAAALYATGRTLLVRGELDAALGNYQRAWRWDPAATMLLEEIVPLAFSLNRPEEAVRYALLSADRGLADPLLLRRLALFVTEQGQPQRAVKLYRQWLAHDDQQRTLLDKVLVQLEVGRLEYMSDDPAAASQILAEVQRTLIEASAGNDEARQVLATLEGNLDATWELCGLAHLEAGRLELAEQAFRQIEASSTPAGNAGYHLALVADAAGDPSAARQHLEAYFATGATDHGREPYQLLAELLKKLDEPQAIIPELTALRQTDPTNPYLAYALADAHREENNTTEAARLFREVVDAENAAQSELAATALSELIALYAEQDDVQQLLDVLAAAAEHGLEVSLTDETLAALDTRPELVKRLVQAASQRLGGGAELPTNLAMPMLQLLVEIEHYEAAETFFEAARAHAPSMAATLTLGWGLDLFLGEKFAAAAEVFRQAIAERLLEENDPTFHHYLAAAMEMEGQTDEALEMARRAAAMRPDSAEFAARLPWVLYHAERTDEAIAAYTEFVRRFDDERDPATRELLRESRFMLSNLTLQAGDREASEEWLAQILDEFPEDPGALNDLGYLWADAGKHLGRARDYIERAVAAEPDSAAYRDSLGWVMYQLGNYDEAVRHLETAVALDIRQDEESEPAVQDFDQIFEAIRRGELEADGIILDHLGDAYLEVQRVDDAVTVWRRAIVKLAEHEPEKAAAVREKLERHSPDSSDE